MRQERTNPESLEQTTMKTARFLIITVTLALAGALGGSNGSAFRDAACRLDVAVQALTGGAGGGTCQP
jgi:hypothetical protein